MLYNVNRDTKKDPKGRDWDDFFPEPRARAPVMSDDQMFIAMQMWAKATAHLKKA